MVKWAKLLGVVLIIIGGSIFLIALIHIILSHNLPIYPRGIVGGLFLVVVGIFILIINAKFHPSKSSSKTSSSN